MSATIAARAHSGSTLSAPARRAAPARRKAPWLSRLGRMIARRPGRALLILTFAGLAASILVNALMFQRVRHPAPMASAPAPSTQTRAVERHVETPTTPVAAPASAPIPPSRPSDLPQTARETQIRPPAAVTSVPRSAAAPAPAAPAPRAAAPRDPIADLINGGDIRPPADIRGGSARAATVRRPVEN